MPVLMGERIRQERIKKGLTQKELAQLIGAKNTAISNWENDINKPDPDYIEKLCSVFSVSPTYLIMGTEDTAITPSDEEDFYQFKKLFLSLNSTGRSKVIDYIFDLVESGNYSSTSIEEDIVDTFTKRQDIIQKIHM